MSAKTGGSLTTILMSVPLAAIPLMAIFGIPQFTTVVASPDNAGRTDDIGLDIDPRDTHSRNSRRTRSSELFDAPADDPSRASFDEADFGNPFDTPVNASDATRVSPESDRYALNGNGSERIQSPIQTGQGGTPLIGHSVVSEQHMAESACPLPLDPEPQMTWRAATRRLEELGIDDYLLGPGESFETFLFCCSFEPAGSTNVVMRFEAEAAEPLAAVADVLDQIDRWLRRSFAESRQAALQSNGVAQ